MAEAVRQERETESAHLESGRPRAIEKEASHLQAELSAVLDRGSVGGDAGVARPRTNVQDRRVGRHPRPRDLLRARFAESRRGGRRPLSRGSHRETAQRESLGALERVARQVRFVGEERRRDDRSMKDLFVKLLSNASTQEFPDNTTIHLREPGWKVGLVDVALPPCRPRLPADDTFLLRFVWTLLVDPENNVYTAEVRDVRPADIPYPWKTGTELLTLVSHKYQWKMRNQTGADFPRWPSGNTWRRP